MPKKRNWFYSDYVADFSGSTETVVVDKMPVLLPKPPKDKDILNYGKPIEQQKMPDLRIPNDIHEWSEEERDDYADNYYFKRKNGFWVFIKGYRLYITGPNFYHLSTWILETGQAPEFKYTDSKWYLNWMEVVRDPKCYGLVVIAARRDGKNERVLSMLCEYATRVRDVICGMQSITQDHVYEKSFKRLMYSFERLNYIAKPINRGNADSKNELKLDYPAKRVTTKELKKRIDSGESVSITSADDYLYKAIGSVISYGPAKESFYDGARLGRYLRDEFGKDEEADPYVTWMTHVKEALMDKTYGTICGKACFISTTAEMGKEAKSLKNATKIWNESDQDKKLSTGQTTTGMYRVFRSALDTAAIDEWGFPKIEEKLAEIKEQAAAFLRNGKIKEMIAYMRKNPLNIEDALRAADEGCIFNQDNLEKRLYRLQTENLPHKAQRGNLLWLDGVQDSKVIWVPNPDGLWAISKHPAYFEQNFKWKCNDNNKLGYFTQRSPVNDPFFTIGVDPYDLVKGVDKDDLSLGGIAARVRFKYEIDGHKMVFDKESDMHVPINQGEDWETDQYILDYIHRHENPEWFFEDVIKTCLYLSTSVLVERGRHGALVQYMKDRGYERFLAFRPMQLRSKGNPSDNDIGCPSDTNTINAYCGKIMAETCLQSNTINHPRIIQQFLRFNENTRTKLDLGVAAGFSHLATFHKSEIIDFEEKMQGMQFTVNWV